MSTPPRHCVSCGRKRRPAEYACPACGCDIYGRSVPGKVAHVETADGFTLRGILEALQLQPGAVVLLSGSPGAGKTTVGLGALGLPRDSARLVAGVTVRRGRRRKTGAEPRQGGALPLSSSSPVSLAPLVLTFEMEAELVLAYARRLHVELGEVVEPELDPVTGAGLELPKVPGVPVFLDSLTATGDPVRTLHQLRDWSKGTGGLSVATVHVTKEGDPRGPKTLEHVADVHIALDTREGYCVATTRKNRFGELFSVPYILTATGAARPTWDRFYSVEGRGPEYRLEPWPSGGRWADPFRHVEQLPEQLPPPPLAVAAERSKLAPGGWQAPADLEARERFAARAGCPFWRVPSSSSSPGA